MSTVKQVVADVIADYPSAASNNAELVIRAWLADPEHQLPDEVKGHLRSILPYAVKGKLRSSESWRRQRQKQMSSN